MQKKTVLITGATSGIGLAGAEALGKRGWRVLVHGRTEERLMPALERLKARVPGGRYEGLAADLGTLHDTAALAEQVKSKTEVLDALWNNAGGMVTKPMTTPEGFELQMGVNYLSPFALTKLLLPLLSAAPQGRIVSTSSMAHSFAPKIPEDWFAPRPGPYKGFVAYGQSKLAIVLFTQELARRLEGTTTTTHAFHPGLVRTNFGSSGKPNSKGTLAYAFLIALSPEKGADTGVFLVDDPEGAEQSGSYWIKRRVRTPSRLATPDAGARLWEQSEAALERALG